MTNFPLLNSQSECKSSKERKKPLSKANFSSVWLKENEKKLSGVAGAVKHVTIFGPNWARMALGWKSCYIVYNIYPASALSQ